MTKTRFTAQLLSGQFVSRTSTTMAYTHAVVSTNRAVSWHTTRELAERGLSQGARYYGFAPDALRVVPVAAEQIQLKRTSPANKNATRRAVITRKIVDWLSYLSRAEASLAAWDAGRSEQEKARLARDFGETHGAELHAHSDRERREAPLYAREQIAKLEEERAALLAEKAEG